MEKIKTKIRIPSQQYAFIELEIEETPERILEIHDEFINLVKPKEGLSDKEWRAALDKYLDDGTMEADAYAQMSRLQTYVIQEIKKSIKRKKYETRF